MNALDGGHELYLAASEAAAEFDNEASGVPSVANADASAPASPLVNGLNTGDVIDTGIFNADGEMVINYYFMQVGESIDQFGFSVSPELNFSAFEQTQISQMLEGFETFMNVDFVQVGTLAEAEMEFALSQTAVADDPNTPEDETVVGDFGSDLNLGFAFFPSGAQLGSAVTLNADGIGWDREATDDDPDGDDGGLLQGGTGLLTAIHEVGHAMGFDHPFEGNDSLLFPGLVDVENNRTGAPGADGIADDVFGDAGSFDLNQDVFTAMSQTQGFLDHPFLGVQGFNDTSARSGGMMAIDIAALQVAYGENDDFASGDDTYTIEDVTGTQNFYASIWDTGGTDEITFGGSAAAIIDLRPATLAVEEGGGGFVSLISTVRGGYTIANDVVIENASSGSGDDLLTGNDVENALDGGSGADTLLGGEGSDTLTGGAGADSLDGGASDDDWADYSTAASDVRADLRGIAAGRGDGLGDEFISIENLRGGDRNDILIGDDDANEIDGGAGRDRLIGGGGDDVFIGGAGADKMFGQDGIDVISYANSAAGVRADLSGATAGVGDGAGDTFDRVENMVGSANDDTLIGDDDANVLTGGAGGDALDGGGGIDWADYSGSTDILRVDLRGIAAGRGDALGDTFTEIENVRGGTAADVLIGDSASNELVGAGGADRLIAGNGDDTLIGGTGADALLGQQGIDTASYAAAESAISADLSNNGPGQGAGDALGDTFSDVENLIGSNFDDTLAGDNANNVLTGGLGADDLSGGDGDDWADYTNAAASVRVDLRGIAAGRGEALGDTLTSIENLRGSEFSDVLFGNGGANELDGGDGVDRLISGNGDDTLIGGAEGDQLFGQGGNDTASYATATAAIAADLSGQTAGVGDALGDSFSFVENLIGSDFDDTLAGDNQVNVFTGGDGADRFAFTSFAESGVGDGARDIIEDFDVNSDDEISFAGLFQLEPLVFGGSAFTGLSGEVITFVLNADTTLIQIDRDGNQTSDFDVELTGSINLTFGDDVTLFDV